MVFTIFGLSVLSAFAGMTYIKPQVETVTSVMPIKQISIIQPELKLNNILHYNIMEYGFLYNVM